MKHCPKFLGRRVIEGLVEKSTALAAEADHDPSSEEAGSDALRDLLTTGDMARLSESTLRTVRFYEEEGLIRPVSRGTGGHRYFPKTELQKLQLALDLRESGLSLNDIKALFDLKAECATAQQASERMTEILEHQIVEMQKKIAKLRKLREELGTMISVLAECRNCDEGRFPVRCQDCDVMTQPELPRALRVLWSE